MAGTVYSSPVVAGTPECSFTVRPEAVCKISFYKLLADPERYNNKYIAVAGYIDIDNGRLAVYPDKWSYRYDVPENSFSVEVPVDDRIQMAKDFSGKYVRVVGLFTFKIVGDKPGIGYVSKVINIYAIGPRVDVPADHSLALPPESVPIKR
jgi:hypothetical protein